MHWQHKEHRKEIIKKTQLHTGTSTPTRAASSHSQQAMAVSMPWAVNILRGDQQRWCRSWGSQSRVRSRQNNSQTRTEQNISALGLKHNHVCLKAESIVKPLLLMSKAASLNMASVKDSGCAESRASSICLIISRPRSDCPRIAWAKWIIPDTCRQKRADMKLRSHLYYSLIEKRADMEMDIIWYDLVVLPLQRICSWGWGRPWS